MLGNGGISLPDNSELNVEQKCEMFAVKNGMTKIPYNFSSNCQTKCVCGELEDNLHIYECELYNVEQHETIPFMKIYNGNLSQQNEVFKQFMKNMDTREKMRTTSDPCDRSDPLFFSKG